MQSVRQGAIHLFRVAGVDVSLHWSWFLVAAYEIQSRKSDYSSILWNALEYLALFLIVLTHEFGHAMEHCRGAAGERGAVAGADWRGDGSEIGRVAADFTGCLRVFAGGFVY